MNGAWERGTPAETTEITPLHKLMRFSMDMWISRTKTIASEVLKGCSTMRTETLGDVSLYFWSFCASLKPTAKMT